STRCALNSPSRDSILPRRKSNDDCTKRNRSSIVRPSPSDVSGESRLVVSSSSLMIGGPLCQYTTRSACVHVPGLRAQETQIFDFSAVCLRSEERRVGKE